MKCPKTVADKTPDQHQSGSEDLAGHGMHADEINPDPHKKCVQQQADQGNRAEFKNGIAMPLVAAKSKAIVQGVVDYCAQHCACRRGCHGFYAQALHQCEEQPIVADGGNHADTGKAGKLFRQINH